MTDAGRWRPEVTLRAATDRDAAMLLAWRNDPEAVRFSRTGRPVTEAEHRAWLVARLVDPATRIWVAEAETAAVGQVRIDIEDGVGTVSVAIAPAERGRGLGSAALGALVTAVEGDPHVTQLRALAHEENVASLRAFERVGFRPRGRGDDGFVILERSVGAHR